LLKRINARIGNYYSAGLQTVVPLSITVYVISILLTNADRTFNVIPDRYNPQILLPFPLPGLGGHPDFRLLLPQPSGTNHGHGAWSYAAAVL
jgi:uncharacterized membrane protein